MMMQYIAIYLALGLCVAGTMDLEQLNIVLGFMISDDREVKKTLQELGEVGEAIITFMMLVFVVIAWPWAVMQGL